MATDKKDLALAYALWALSLVGICGVQRMYLGQSGYAITLLFTFGFCGVGQVLDLLLLPEAVEQANQRLGFIAAESILPMEQFKPVQTTNTPHTPEIMSQKIRSADDDELDMLLRQAEHSVSRTNEATKEGPDDLP